MANEKRLIDAYALTDVIEHIDWYHIGVTGKLSPGANPEHNIPLFKADDIYEALEKAPTVDAVEVVHAKWEKASETMPIYKCSVCGERNLFRNGDNVLSNYCPNCGAKMTGDENEQKK